MAIDPNSGPAEPNLNAAEIQTSVLTNLSIRTLYRGDIMFPCIPAAIASYVQHIDKLLWNFGRGFSAEEKEQVIQLFQQTLIQGFKSSPNAQMVFHYEVKGSADLQKELACNVSLIQPTLTEQYEQWFGRGTDTIFGQMPDAKVMDLAKTLSPSTEAPILDIGAGYGRNALPLARLGHPVHVVEMTSEFVAAIRSVANQESLPIQLFEQDLFDPTFPLESDKYALIVASEVTSHFRGVEQLQLFLTHMADCLQTDGYLLFNIFLAHGSYEPQAMEREMSQIAWSTVFTRTELFNAIAALPLVAVSDESALAYEQQHLPEHAWPSTPWFEDWALGKSTFPFLETSPPMELRWLVFKKQVARENTQYS